MFSWFKHKPKKSSNEPRRAVPIQRAVKIVPPPLLIKTLGTRLQCGFSDGVKQWTERADLIELFAHVLKSRELEFVVDGECFQDVATGLIFQPQFLEMQPVHQKGSRTVTIIQVSHPTLFPKGIFEFQHWTGSDLAESIAKGFELWAQSDLDVLRDATAEKPRTCMVLQMDFKPADDLPAHGRRVVLGPVSYLRKSDVEAEDPEHPPFCACCMLTKNFETFKPFIESRDFLGIRLFAMRNEDGTASADCRINGQEFEEGKAALRNYASTWPDTGVQFRKQHVIMQNYTASNVPAAEPA